MRSSAPFALKRGTPNSEFSLPMTPGSSSAKLYGLRETSGRFFTSRSLMLRPMSILPRSTAGVSAVTVIASDTVLTFSVSFSTSASPAVSSTSVCSSFEKPFSWKISLYLPSGSSAARYRPEVFVSTTRCVPVSMLTSVTVTPGSTAPWMSLTVPSMEPLTACDCARAGRAHAHITTSNNARR